MSLIDRPVISRISDGRLQMRHGPIELVIKAFGSESEVALAYQQAAVAFGTVLNDLASELGELRKPARVNDIGAGNCAPAVSMHQAASAFADSCFLTPMIAVAGAVADHILEQMIAGRDLSRAYVNNGGDIALHLNKDECFEVAVCADPLKRKISSKTCISQCSGIRGIATSGWRGRSHSLGIADAVTVLASSAAVADASATLIANAIDLPNHPSIYREKATDLSPDSDLAERGVTVDVGELTPADARTALAAGKYRAQKMIDDKQIIGVYAILNSEEFSLHPNIDPKIDNGKEFRIGTAATISQEMLSDLPASKQAIYSEKQQQFRARQVRAG